MDSVGKLGELNFCSYALKMGWKPRKSERYQDMIEHVDFFIHLDGIDFGVDVKGFKKSSAKGLLLIELLNVYGNKGWIYGKSDFIALQMSESKDDFLLLLREDLKSLMHERMQINCVEDLNSYRLSSDRNCLAPFWYRRPQRLDGITNIKIKDAAFLS